MKVILNLSLIRLLLISITLYGCAPKNLPDTELVNIQHVQLSKAGKLSDHFIFDMDIISKQSLKNITQHYEGLNTRLICSTNSEYQISGVASDFDDEQFTGKNFSNPIYLEVCLKDDINTCIKNTEEFKYIPIRSTCHLVLVRGVFGTQPRISHHFIIKNTDFLTP